MVVLTPSSAGIRQMRPGVRIAIDANLPDQITVFAGQYRGRLIRLGPYFAGTRRVGLDWDSARRKLVYLFLVSAIETSTAPRS